MHKNRLEYSQIIKINFYVKIPIKIESNIKKYIKFDCVIKSIESIIVEN